MPVRVRGGRVVAAARHADGIVARLFTRQLSQGATGLSTKS